MPDKQSRRGKASRYEEEDDFIMADGAVARLIDRACENPAMSGGLFVMALTATAIISNAMFLQNVRHPEPLFSTRPAATFEQPPAPVSVSAPPTAVSAAAPAESVPLPPARDELSALIAPMPRPAPVLASAPASMEMPAAPTASTPEPSAVVPAAIDGDLLRDIQTVLAEKGLYLGTIDGEYGSLSRSAISAYEAAEGLPVTGEPSAALLAHLRQEATGGAAPTPPEPVVNVAAEQAELERLRYQKVQIALNRIGYGPVNTNGAADEATVNAIRRFELDNGLPISGSASEELVERLVTIGALPAT